MSKVKVAIAIPKVRHLLLAIAMTMAVVNWSTASSSADSLTSELPMLLVQNNDAEINFLARQVHKSINQYRAKQNLPPLILNSHISQQAQIHSQNMAQQVVEFSHQGFETRIKALKGQVIYRRAAENVAYNQGYQDPVQRAVAGWIESQGHHENLLGNFDLTGIGVAKNERGEYYFTQIFIKEN